MADANKYKSVSLRHKTYCKLKDLQHHNPYMSVSIASVITYLVNKEHKQQYDKVCPYGDYDRAVAIPRSSSEVSIK